MKITIIGGGLAGAEAAYQLLKRGHAVTLYEMRSSTTSTPAHHTEDLAELVCSNSLKSNRLDNAAGILKAEMRMLDSLIIQVADQVAIPAGQALAVDRERFSQLITQRLLAYPNFTLIREEVTILPSDGIALLATGPLTSEALAAQLQSLLGEDQLYFYDAAAPVVHVNDIDFSIAYRKSRYDKGGDDYINCPFTKDQFLAFYEALTTAEQVTLKEFEKKIYFESCLPIEVIAKRHEKSLRFGPMKPVGLQRPDGTRPYAVVQLRQDNAEGTLFNLVGFQTNLKFPEQQRVFRMIPGLEKVVFYRYGFMHRNTFINSTHHLTPTLQLKVNERLFVAGQLTGVEGYIESAASGILAAINMDRYQRQLPPITAPDATVLGSLIRYITTPSKHFQPMNSNFGILPNLVDDRAVMYERAMSALRQWMMDNELS